jgi:hypothetical protein
LLYGPQGRAFVASGADEFLWWEMGLLGGGLLIYRWLCAETLGCSVRRVSWSWSTIYVGYKLNFLLLMMGLLDRSVMKISV